MNAKKMICLILVVMLAAAFLTACGECKHNYQERDGRVVCLECKEVCAHTYQIEGNNAYCSNCLFSCKHAYTETNGEVVCSQCSIKCSHKYVEKDGDAACEQCGKKCDHEYEVSGTEAKCKICNLACAHQYEDKNGEMVCSKCALKCSHKYIQKDGDYVCEHCGKACVHEFEESNSKRTCKHCGYEKVMLTLDNVNDYFSVNVKITELKVQKDWFGTTDRGTGSADVTVTNKTNAKFNNVVLTIVLETSSDSWFNVSREVEITYDGTGMKTYALTSRSENYVSTNPTFKAKITNVTGEIAE